jgi:hypothetical protein
VEDARALEKHRLEKQTSSVLEVHHNLDSPSSNSRTKMATQKSQTTQTTTHPEQKPLSTTSTMPSNDEDAITPAPATPEVPQPAPFVPPDGGTRAWLTVAGGWLCQFCSFGFINA